MPGPDPGIQHQVATPDRNPLKVHVCNVLSEVFRCVSLKEISLFDSAFALALAGFKFSSEKSKDEIFALRNSSLKLFGRLMIQIFGSDYTKTISISTFSIRYPKTFEMILQSLDSSKRPFEIIQPLLLIRQLYPTIMDNRENQTDILFEKTAEILKVSDWKCRKIAAQALAAINSKHPIFTVKKLMENLSNGQNYSHGILLAVLELLKKTDEKLDFRLDQKVFLGLHSHSKDLLCKIVRLYGVLSLKNTLKDMILMYLNEFKNDKITLQNETALFLVTQDQTNCFQEVEIEHSFISLLFAENMTNLVAEKESSRSSTLLYKFRLFHIYIYRY